MPKDIPLVLDSTAFKSSPKLNSALFRQLLQHINVGIFKLYIPEIVEREYLTWILEDAQKSYDKIVQAAKSLNKYYEKTEVLGFEFEFNSTAMIAESQINQILENVSKNWDKFKASSSATIVPIEHAHTMSVMDAYFKGTVPFKTLKHRQDIPDAFIFNAMLDLLKDNDKVLFVTHDKSLIDRIEDQNIVCFENLVDLFSTSGYKISGEYFRSLRHDDRAISLLSYFSDYIQAKCSEEIEFSEYVEEVNDNISGGVIGELDFVSASIQIVNFDEKAIGVITENTYLLPFTTKITHAIHSKATVGDLAILEKTRAESLEKEVQSDGQVNIIEYVRNVFEGNISINFAESDPSSWVEKKKDQFLRRTHIEEISISLEDIRIVDGSRIN